MTSKGRPKGTGGKAEVLKPEEIKRIDKLLDGSRNELRDRALFYLGLGTGMRISEILSLMVRDVSPDGVHVLSRIVLEKHSTKSCSSRTVSVSKQAIEYLKAYLKSWTPVPDDPLFPSIQYPMQPMSCTAAIMRLKRMFKSAGIAHASSHSMRRTHANTLRRNGVDLKIIKEQLGHSSLAITDRYFTVDPIDQDQAIENLKF